jgi:hypothetical protein
VISIENKDYRVVSYYWKDGEKTMMVMEGALGFDIDDPGLA